MALIIDHRKTTLKETKRYNNVRNYLLGKDDTRKGNKELDRQKLLELVFPDDINNSGLIDSDNDRINNWLKSSNNSITAEDYILLSKHFDYDALIFFRNVDEICEFENSILKACFHKIIDFTRKKFDEDKFLPIELKRMAVKSPDHFYFQVVESSINFMRLISSKLITLEEEIYYRGLDMKLLQKYLTTSFDLIKTKIFPRYQTWGDFSFKDARNGTINDKRIIDALAGLDAYTQKDTLATLKAINGESAQFILGNDGNIEKADWKVNKNEIEEAKLKEDTGMYLTNFGRFLEYNNLSKYHSKWNKSIEIIAVNNWIDLFESLKTQLLLHSSEFELKDQIQPDTDNKEEYFIEKKCNFLLFYISSYRFHNISMVDDPRDLNGLLKEIDNTGECVLPILLQEYRNMLNNSVNPAIFTDELV